MKKTILLLSIATLGGVIVGCQPEANFRYDKENAIAVPATVQFTNLSREADTYTWNFGDGSEISTEVNPVHVYQRGGKYQVILTASNDHGSDDKSTALEIYRPVQIYPGEKMLNIALNEEWSSVKKKLDADLDHDYEYVADLEVYLHMIDDASHNLLVCTLGLSDSIRNDDIVFMLYAMDDFEGTTEKGVGLGDEFSILSQTYGTPDEYDGWFSSDYNSYDYDRLGISFIKYFTVSDIKIIMIYSPIGKSASLRPGLNASALSIRNLVKDHLLQ